MSPEELQQIESELGITLPVDYREAMLNYPLDRDPLDETLCDDVELLIKSNLYYRKHKFFGLEWPGHYFTFGGDGFGNRFFLDLTLTPSPVFFADHEVREYREDKPSLEAWLEMVMLEQAEYRAELDAENREAEADRQARLKKKETKQWWQFWI